MTTYEGIVSVHVIKNKSPSQTKIQQLLLSFSNTLPSLRDKASTTFKIKVKVTFQKIYRKSKK